MTYGEFIEAVKTEEMPGQNVLKESALVNTGDPNRLELKLDSIRKDITVPEFYDMFAKLETIELMQGAEILEKPHYEKQE
jgi:hypothetical protein